MSQHAMVDIFAINEERVLALAGMFQATALAHQLANEGCCDAQALEASLQSVFRIDAPSVAGVFGGVSQVRLGLRTLVRLMDHQMGNNLAIPRMVATLIRLERRLASRTDLLDQLKQGIMATGNQVTPEEQGAPQAIARLAALYTSTLSTLKPRVMVNGQPQWLRQDTVVEKIRASLLAAVRATVLWHQVGGRQWQCLFHRRQCAMLARGLLTGTTLDSG